MHNRFITRMFLKILTIFKNYFKIHALGAKSPDLINSPTSKKSCPLVRGKFDLKSRLD